MKYRFKVMNHRYDVSLPNDATFHSETRVRIGHSDLKVLINESDGDDIKSFFVNHRFFRVRVVRDHAGYPRGIYVNDRFYPASLQKIDQLFYYREKDVKTDKPGRVFSFIPGNIKRIFFSVNDRVKENDIILIHEAMKMENEIRAPRSGIIKSINVREGDNILTDHLLFEIG